MKNITISLKALYANFGENLKYGTISKSVDGEWEYYDLETSDGTVCMDGETCEIVENDGNIFTLRSIEEEEVFKLTKEEVSIGSFGTFN